MSRLVHQPRPKRKLTQSPSRFLASYREPFEILNNQTNFAKEPLGLGCLLQRREKLPPILARYARGQGALASKKCLSSARRHGKNTHGSRYQTVDRRCLVKGAL